MIVPWRFLTCMVLILSCLRLSDAALIEVDARVLDVKEFTAPEFHTMTMAVDSINGYLDILVQNISTLVRVLHNMSTVVDVAGTVHYALNVTAKMSRELTNVTSGVNTFMHTMNSEMTLLNKKVINGFLPTFTGFSSHLNGNFSSLNKNLGGFFKDLDIEVLIGQVVNTCILGIAFLGFWLYFSRLWPTKVEDLKFDTILTGFAIPAIPLLIGSVVLELVWFPFLIVDRQSIRTVFVKNLVYVIPFLLLGFSAFQVLILVVWVLYRCFKARREGGRGGMAKVPETPSDAVDEGSEKKGLLVNCSKEEYDPVFG